jgi:hypothetical protein
MKRCLGVLTLFALMASLSGCLITTPVKVAADAASGAVHVAADAV